MRDSRVLKTSFPGLQLYSDAGTVKGSVSGGGFDLTKHASAKTDLEILDFLAMASYCNFAYSALACIIVT